MTDYKRKAAAELAAEQGIPGDTYVCGQYEATRIRSVKNDELVITRSAFNGAIQTYQPGSLDLEKWVTIKGHEEVEDGVWQVTAWWDDD